MLGGAIGNAASTAIPFAVGAVIAAIGSLMVIMRSDAFDKKSQAGYVPSRRSTVRVVLIIYAVIAWTCLMAAVAIGDVAFIVTTGIVALLATVGLVLLRLRPDGW